MQLTFHTFEPDTPQQPIYQQGVDYLAHEYDVSPEEAYSFIEKLNDPRDSFYLHDPEGYGLHVWKEKINPSGLRYRAWISGLSPK